MEPLVSIIIVTFNSSKTIIETLESAKIQSYGPIEIVVSDDSSTDDTVRICKEWLYDNRSRFVRSEVVCSEENTGVSANFNRGVIRASGEWAKLIAGDDIMLPNCIADNIRYVNDNVDAFFVFSKMSLFSMNQNHKVIMGRHPKEVDMPFFSLTALEQHKYLYNHNCLPAPTFFCNLKKLKDNLFNEQYRYCEDFPQWFALTSKGYKLFLNPVETVQYRMANSLSNSDSHFCNPYHMLTLKMFFYNEMADHLFQNDKDEYNKRVKSFFMLDFAVHILNNKSNVFNRFVYKLVASLFYK